MAQSNSRRIAIKQLMAGSIAMGSLSPFVALAAENMEEKYRFKGNINHSVCRWTYNFMPLEELCTAVKKIGFAAIDLVGPKDWPVLQQHGIFSSMCNGAEISLTEGWPIFRAYKIYCMYTYLINNLA